MSQQQPATGPGQVLQIYDQLPGENALWYGRFRAYLELGSARTIIGVHNAERHRDGKAATTDIPGAWTAASTKFKWKARAKAWDAAAVKAADESRLEVVRADAAARTKEEIRNRRRQDQENEEWRLGELLIQRGEEMLASTLYSKRATKDGKGIEVKPARWAMRDAVKMIDLAMKLRRMSCRMPLQAEPDTSGDLGATFFESSGEIESVMPEGTVPSMPSDVCVKPPIGDLKPQAGKQGAPSQPRIERPADRMPRRG